MTRIVDIILRFLLSMLLISGLWLIIPGSIAKKRICAVITIIPIMMINMRISPLFAYYNVPLSALGFELIIVILIALLLRLFGLILK